MVESRGYEEYIPLAKKYRVPIVVTGFEPVDILQGVSMMVKQLEEARADGENQYARSVRREGNIPARKLMAEVFEVTERAWRGLGMISSSGYKLTEAYADFDAGRVFDIAEIQAEESPLCIAGLVLQGLKNPYGCSAFGQQCTPERPLGAPMVSSEGACAAYFQYRMTERNIVS